MNNNQKRINLVIIRIILGYFLIVQVVENRNSDKIGQHFYLESGDIKEGTEQITSCKYQLSHQFAVNLTTQQ